MEDSGLQDDLSCIIVQSVMPTPLEIDSACPSLRMSNWPHSPEGNNELFKACPIVYQSHRHYNYISVCLIMKLMSK